MLFLPEKPKEIDWNIHEYPAESILEVLLISFMFLQMSC